MRHDIRENMDRLTRSTIRVIRGASEGHFRIQEVGHSKHLEICRVSYLLRASTYLFICL